MSASLLDAPTLPVVVGRPFPDFSNGVPPLRLRVLVVDDNRDAADTLAELVRMHGADVRVCYDGACAAEEAVAFRPDVGLFDVNMPRLDGCELARRVRAAADGRPLLLVAVTGVTTEAAWRRTCEAGFNKHLTKPTDPRALLVTLAGFDWFVRRRRGEG